MSKRICLLILTLVLPAFAIADDTTSAQLFIVHFETGDNWDESVQPAEQVQFREHSANLNRLRGEGTIVFGARYGDFGVIVIKAVSLAAARSLIKADPGVQSGIFDFRVESLNVFYPWEQNVAVASPSPENRIVGVWAAPESILKGALLFQGQAVYLGEDCVGAIVGGPPPIGARIVASYDAGAGPIEFDMFDDDQIVRRGTLLYHPETDRISLDGTLHTRRFAQLDSKTRQDLGLEPAFERQVAGCGD